MIGIKRSCFYLNEEWAQVDTSYIFIPNIRVDFFVRASINCHEQNYVKTNNLSAHVHKLPRDTARVVHDSVHGALRIIIRQ